MHSHLNSIKDSISCPFAICFKNINWDDVKEIISVDDKERTIIVDTHDQRYLVNVPFALYDAIYKSGERNVEENDLGFDDNY